MKGNCPHTIFLASDTSLVSFSPYLFYSIKITILHFVLCQALVTASLVDSFVLFGVPNTTILTILGQWGEWVNMSNRKHQGHSGVALKVTWYQWSNQGLFHIRHTSNIHLKPAYAYLPT